MDGQTDVLTGGRTENRTLISHPAKAGVTKMYRLKKHHTIIAEYKD